MSEPHRHHHPPGQGHTPAAAGASLLRLSVWQRLAVAAVAVAVLWAATFWAMH
ncbi:MAG: hypothetical protein J0H89_06100 [Rhizobiales bacterium]|nr:hypothetical protein [Hyphomicrobiales bacterium]